MVKYLLNSLFIFFILSSFSFAKNVDIEAKLKSEYGPDLTKAPFSLRYSFSKIFKKDWKNSYYAERHVFLANYESSLAAEEVQEKADARAEAASEKERLREKKEAERKERDRLKAQLAQEKAENKENEERQKEFEETEKGQQNQLQEMKRLGTQGNN